MALAAAPDDAGCFLRRGLFLRARRGSADYCGFAANLPQSLTFPLKKGKRNKPFEPVFAIIIVVECFRE
jgi:hypothetical protein